MDSNEGGRFGAVIVHNQRIVSTGRNQVILRRDPIAHAKVMAIRNACVHLGKFSLEDCEIYTSPCADEAQAAFQVWVRKQDRTNY